MIILNEFKSGAAGEQVICDGPGKLGTRERENRWPVCSLARCPKKRV